MGNHQLYSGYPLDCTSAHSMWLPGIPDRDKLLPPLTILNPQRYLHQRKFWLSTLVEALKYVPQWLVQDQQYPKQVAAGRSEIRRTFRAKEFTTSRMVSTFRPFCPRRSSRRLVSWKPSPTRG